MKLLHLTHHNACQADVEAVAKAHGYELITMRADWSYNVDETLARSLWLQHKEYFNSFDCIITSDTAPLSRIFLQNMAEFKAKLIIWVCNRFDYADEGPNGINNPYKFPDKGYIDLFKSAATLTTNNQQLTTKIFSYTQFEHEYAQKKYGFTWQQQQIIRPTGIVSVNPFTRSDKAGMFFIPDYHNDTKYEIDPGKHLQDICKQLHITTYQGVYNGMQDLWQVNGIIHIPYAWSNFALFENWNISNVYFIPSKEFLLALSAKPNFFWSPPFHKDYIESSEWYLPEYKENFLYFDSWQHLQWLTQQWPLIHEKQKIVKQFAVQHQQKTLQQWKNAIEIW